MHGTHPLRVLVWGLVLLDCVVFTLAPLRDDPSVLDAEDATATELLGGAKAAVRKGMWPYALDLLHRAVHRFPHHSELLNTLGVVLYRTGALWDARQAFHTAMSLDPTDDGIQGNRAGVERLLHWATRDDLPHEQDAHLETVPLSYQSLYDPRIMPRVAILTASTANGMVHYAPALFNHECYAARHGYPFIFEVNDRLLPEAFRVWGGARLQSGEPRTKHWIKVAALRKYLPHYEWIAWLDADTVIRNASIRLEQFLDDRYDLILTDHSRLINNGVFFLRNTAWSQEFLRRWWDEGLVPYNWFDNGAMYNLLLKMASTSTGLPYDEECARYPTCCTEASLLEECANKWFDVLIGPYRHRHLPHVLFWDPKGGPVPGGFDTFDPVHKDEWKGWAEESWYHPGAFLIHVIDKKTLGKWAAFAPQDVNCTLT